MKDVFDFLNYLNIKDEYIVVAVSYGPDSMFLLDILKNKYKKIVCAHVNHNLMLESENEQKELEKYCKKNNIIFEVMKIDKYSNNKLTESEARTKRYNFFDSLMKKYDSRYLFTAHHGDDLVETVLMRMVRGSSISGYSGIKLISNRSNYKIVRPLLYLTKDQILNNCKDLNIPFAVDKSNLNNKYTRNRYRNKILPLLKEENKNVHLKFLEFSSKIQDYENYIQKVIDEKYNKIISDNVIDLDKLNSEESLIIDKIIEKYLFNNYNEEISLITDKNINEFHKLLSSSNANLFMTFPNKKVLVKSYNKIYFDKKKVYNDFCYEFKDCISLPNGYKVFKVEELDDTSNYETALYSSDIKLPIYIRNRKPRDKIEILGMTGSKKLKDVFINSKINIENRNNYPVVVDSDNNVLWLPGLKKSKYDKSKGGKYDIILKYQQEVLNDTE